MFWPWWKKMADSNFCCEWTCLSQAFSPLLHHYRVCWHSLLNEVHEFMFYFIILLCVCVKNKDKLLPKMLILLIWALELFCLFLWWGFGLGETFIQTLPPSFYSIAYSGMAIRFQSFTPCLCLHGEIFAKGTLLCIVSMLFPLCPYTDLFMVTR